MLGEQHEILNEDALAMGERLQTGSSSQTNRRAFVHAVSAYVEGCVYGLRQTTLAIDNESRVLDEADRGVLLEQSYRVDDRGRSTSGNAHHPFKNMLLFSFVSFAKVYGIPYKPDTSGQGWRAVKRFIDLRNRITHPKSAADLNCSDQDVDDTLAAFQWFHEVILDIGQKIPEAPSGHA